MAVNRETVSKDGGGVGGDAAVEMCGSGEGQLPSVSRPGTYTLRFALSWYYGHCSHRSHPVKRGSEDGAVAVMSTSVRTFSRSIGSLLQTV
jgi:hypothetical protein